MSILHSKDMHDFAHGPGQSCGHDHSHDSGNNNKDHHHHDHSDPNHNCLSHKESKATHVH